MQYLISVYLNRIPDSYNIFEDFEKTRLYHFKHGVDIKFVFKNVDIKGYTSVFNATKNRWLIQGADKLLSLDSSADANIFVFDQGEWGTLPGSPFPLKPETPNGSCQIVNNKPFICVGAYIADHLNGQLAIQIAHEIMHSYTQNAYLKQVFVKDVMDTYRENTNWDSPTGNFAEQWKLLESYFKKPMYKYFKDSEIVGLKPELVRKLDLARDYAGVSFAITSGLRTKAQNDSLPNAVEDSAHLTGLACDIACPDSVKRWKIIQGALQAGFKRIGIGRTFVHLDVALDKPQNVIWHYY